MSVLRYDKASPLGKPVRLPNGFLRADGYLTRTGIFVYRDAAGNRIRELRVPEEVMDRRTLDSFALVPVTNDHPPELLTADNAKQYAVGAVSEAVVPEGDKVRASLMITDAETIADIEAGKSELSCGYTADVVQESGIWNGQRYDARQTNIRGNHVAIVDVGRAGPLCALRMDAAVGAAEEITTMEEVMMELGGAQYAVPADLAAEIAKMLEAKGLKPAMSDGKGKEDKEKMKALDEAKADMQRKIDSLQARLDGLQSSAAAQALREKIELEVREDIAVAELAKRFDCVIAAGDTTDAKRRKVVAKLDSSIVLDGKSSEYVSGVLEALVQARGDSAIASARAGTVKTDASASDDDPAEAARKAMIARFELKKGGN